jgi:hypothetical protein
MDGAWHFRQAERLLWLAGPDSPAEPTREELGLMLWSANTHAMLAQAAATLEQSSMPVSTRWREVLATTQPKAPAADEHKIPDYPPRPTPSDTPGKRRHWGL